ncbi:hypothetical protein L1987_60364 [Smallanthus sonchifolius]|uniref:Uncharacterized protein n=1 Tax=Smallanthus sonchifolius TaxID=185202 RepID=A0ACB9D7X5_9ASTR|nr:hypothetical protein L1987_60364 [Smallanthus sonchifolius]
MSTAQCPSGKLVQIKHAVTTVGTGHTSLGIKGSSIYKESRFAMQMMIKSLPLDVVADQDVDVFDIQAQLCLTVVHIMLFVIGEYCIT